MLLACCYGNDEFDTAIITQHGDSLVKSCKRPPGRMVAMRSQFFDGVGQDQQCKVNLSIKGKADRTAMNE